MNKLEVSEVQIIPVVPREGLVGFCSFLINKQLYVGNVAIYTRPNGKSYRLVYPISRLSNGKTISCIHPITKMAGEIMQEAVVKRFEKITKRSENKLYAKR